mmetsp:Transcript_38987/g.60068  ORF Transcript_38987/g.60068 Transcript_38987/m.60068 type:complete len:128 (-) Transcript_38987:28-411(-)
MSQSCEHWASRNEKCRVKHGKKAERCLPFELEEKRCLSFRHCVEEAKPYYGTPSEEKAQCASWEEASCFGNPRIMKIDAATGTSKTKEQIFEQHLKARRRVQNNRQKFRACQELSSKLSSCLRRAGF